MPGLPITCGIRSTFLPALRDLADRGRGLVDGFGDLFEEIVSNVELIISGGFNDARDAIATLSWHLLTHPEARSRAMAEPVTFERAFGSLGRFRRRDLSAAVAVRHVQPAVEAPL